MFPHYNNERERERCPFYVGLTYTLYIKILIILCRNYNSSGSPSGYARNIYKLPGFSRDSPNSRAGLFPRLSELQIRAFPESFRTPEPGFSRDSLNSRAGLFPRLSKLSNLWHNNHIELLPNIHKTPNISYDSELSVSRDFMHFTVFHTEV